MVWNGWEWWRYWMYRPSLRICTYKTNINRLKDSEMSRFQVSKGKWWVVKWKKWVKNWWSGSLFSPSSLFAYRSISTFVFERRTMVKSINHIKKGHFVPSYCWSWLILMIFLLVPEAVQVVCFQPNERLKCAFWTQKNNSYTCIYLFYRSISSAAVEIDVKNNIEHISWWGAQQVLGTISPFFR